jgi:hypothetical protein
MGEESVSRGRGLCNAKIEGAREVYHVLRYLHGRGLKWRVVVHRNSEPFQSLVYTVAMPTKAGQEE